MLNYNPKILNKKKLISMRGFTLIELVVVFSISAIISTVSLAAFSSYSSSQVYRTAVSDFVSMLNSARSKSVSQVKPEQCSGSSLDGYQVSIDEVSSNYQLNVICGGSISLPVIESRTLPEGVMFGSGSVSSIRFEVSSGAVNSESILTVEGFGKANTVTVDTTGFVNID